MDQGDQEREFCEKLGKPPKESEPDGYKAIKNTLAVLIGRKSRNKKPKEKSNIQTQKDEDSTYFITDQDYQEDPPPLQETSEPAWVYPRDYSLPTDPAHLPTPWDNAYPFRHEIRGVAVLVINSVFDSQADRRNAVWDEYYMNKMFEELNFHVKVLRSLSSKELLENMRAIRNAIGAESDCFACVISSHGMEGQVSTSTPGVRDPFVRTEHFTYTRDGVVRTNELLELFNDRNCRPLKGKPKMFFIQACRSRLDVQRPDEIDTGVTVEVQLVETTATTSTTGSPAIFLSRGDTAQPSSNNPGDTGPTGSNNLGDMAQPSCSNSGDMAPTSSNNLGDMAPTNSNNSGDMASTNSENTKDVVPIPSTTTGDVVGNYEDYAGRRRDEYRKNFTAATLDPSFENSQVYGISRQYPGYYQKDQRGYEDNVQASLQRQVPSRTPTYKFIPTEPEPEPEPVEVFQIPCYNDYLVMFSSAAGTIAWSDSGKGGWLMYCLYQVLHDVTNTDDDLLRTLTRVSGKMARDMETYCPSTPHYDKAKSAACVYHKLTKDIYLQPVSYL